MPLRPVGSADIRRALSDAGRLPQPLPRPVNRFSLARVHHGVAYVSSMTPLADDGTELTGVIDIDADSALTHARAAAEWSVANSLLGLCTVLDEYGGGAYGALDMLVFCNAPEGFGRQSDVADAASELLGKVFPDSADSVRGAIGARSLVRDVTVVVKASYLIETAPPITG